MDSCSTDGCPVSRASFDSDQTKLSSFTSTEPFEGIAHFTVVQVNTLEIVYDRGACRILGKGCSQVRNLPDI
ncbi:hypothetical protein HZ326_24546 [Fusarium oxysporum f. sp. albedinis]|nr:hypothetical protein HZ326_24546 [Fusarium oxysporum f. sp. albedinis]